MLINFTNHPSNGWSKEQKDAAIEKYGEVRDISFPHINPDADELDLKVEALKYVEEIIKLKPMAVHIMGEMNFTFLMVYFLMKEGIECVASTTKRIVEDYPDGSQKSVFKFVKYRAYNFLNDDSVSVKSDEIVLSDGQQEALDQLKSFVFDDSGDQIFVLKGYAGTGKTTLLKYFIAECSDHKKTITLMASTGRAASVLKAKARFNATTVHSLVYKFDEVKATSEDAWLTEGDEKGQLYLNFTPCILKDEAITDIYIIDEASMISGTESEKISGTKFGSGNLLQDLLEVVGENKIIFVGDPCQLPPVDDASFPAALDSQHLKTTYDKQVCEYELTEIQRQGANSEILEMATPLREMIVSNQIPEWPRMVVQRQFKDVKIANSTSELIEQFLSVFKTVGSQNAILITHKNEEAFRNNSEIRKNLFPGKSEIQVGDILMISKNCMLTGLRNGDQVVVMEVFGLEHRARQTFRKIKVKNINSGVVHETLLLESFLNNALPQMDPMDNKLMIIDFDARMRESSIKRNSLDYKKRMKDDPYLNGLHAKYGYAITLQKAQGGEWLHVFLNITKSVYVSKFNGQPQDMVKWFYTAVTRTQKYLVINLGSWVTLQ